MPVHVIHTRWLFNTRSYASVARMVGVNARLTRRRDRCACPLAPCRGRPFSCGHAWAELVDDVLTSGKAAVTKAAPVVPKGLPVFDPTAINSLTLGR